MVEYDIIFSSKAKKLCDVWVHIPILSDLVWTKIVLELYLISLILHNLVMSFFRNYTQYHFSRSILLFLLAFEDVVHIVLIDAGLIVCLELTNVSDIAALNIY